MARKDERAAGSPGALEKMGSVRGNKAPGKKRGTHPCVSSLFLQRRDTRRSPEEEDPIAVPPGDSQRFPKKYQEKR